MTQSNDLSATLKRLQAEAQRKQALVAESDEQAWERHRAEVLTILAALIAALVAARITVREFEQLMTLQIRQSHLFAYAVGRGGLELLTDADRAAINARVNGQIDFLKAWAAALTVTGGVVLLSGKAVSEAALRARAELYVEATRASLFEGAGARIGLPRLPAYPGDGTTRCRSRCACSWRVEQVEGDGNWDCYWLLGSFESCEHCPRRAVAWHPLRIRGGEVQSYVRAGLFL